MHLISALYLLSLVQPFTYAYTWPSPQYDTLEALLYEGRRSDGSSLASLVHPCRKRTGTLASVGAEWLRFAFHDMATHNVDDGSGGLDGSIVYELGRAENFGLGFNQTLSDFEAFPNKLVSRADVISIGAILAVSSCGGPILPFRGGRVDTWTGGGTGTPEPQQDLSTLTESFRKQGFNQTDMIKLVACGHTMGGVRSADFPQLVPPNPNSVNPVIDDFDTTMAFDNAVVTEYLDGTTQNVLVTTSNATMASDLRVFQCDGNSTMRSLADASTFQSECNDVLTRMLNTVPEGVTLTDEITLLPAKVSAAQLTIEKSQLVFKSTFRLTQKINTTASANRNVTMFWCDKYGDNANCTGKTNAALPVSKLTDDPNISPVTLNMGFFFYEYNYVVPVISNASIAKFWFKVDEGDGSTPTVYDNGGNGYVIDQDQVLFVPMLSHVDVVANTSLTQTYTNRDASAFTRVYNLVVAVRDGVNPSRVYFDATDIAVSNFPYPVGFSADLALNSSMPSVAGYSFYTTMQVQDSGVQLTLDIHAVGSSQTYTQLFAETLLLDNTPYVQPGTVTTTADTTSNSTRKNAAGRTAGVAHAVLAAIVGGAVLSMAL
ncbi:L-ascorbate oxidase [Pholiota conissans]|uniref:Peroxidase n=1 Tax=Pholiota conissans TaxID=109636 RepID=A0A9P5Z0S6_9AGAR|nr:L-ascorbate oxidase [Pholiota conissans]